jgi:hypothetical protein
MSRKSTAAKLEALVSRVQDLRSNVDALTASLRDEQAALDEALDQMVALIEDEDAPVAPKEQAAPKSQKQRSTARKPKATQGAPDGFEAEGQFVYTKGDGSKSIWTITSIEDAAVMAHRQGTTKSRPWKFTSLAAMLQTGNVSLDLSEVVSKPKRRSTRKAA